MGVCDVSAEIVLQMWWCGWVQWVGALVVGMGWRCMGAVGSDVSIDRMMVATVKPPAG